MAAVPAMPGIGCASASRLAARIIIFDDTQSRYGHSRPTGGRGLDAADESAVSRASH